MKTNIILAGVGGQGILTIATIIDSAALEQGLNLKQTLIQVMLPAAKGGVLVAAALSFAHTMGEFGVVLMVGGSIPGETKVASIALFEMVEMQQQSEAWVLALILMAVSFVMLSVVYTMNRQGLNMGVGT